MHVQTLNLSGRKYVILPENEFRRLVSEPREPAGPEPNADGTYPALEAMDAINARDILRARRRLGLSQVELAKRAGIRRETLDRIERADRPPSVATMKKIDRALTKLEARHRA